MILDERTRARRAIEALRAGVPNGDAVRVLGSAQPELEKQFRAQLQNTRDGLAENRQSGGLLIAGDFGSGKSHLLEYFKHIALEENFICSKLVMSKETPLYDPAKVYRAAVETATVPGRRGTGLTEIAASLDFNRPAYTGFFRWLQAADNGLSPQFAASLYLFEYAKNEDEIRNRIIRFWSGDPFNASELKRYLREIGEAATYKIERIPVRELAVQRFYFTPRLMAAAGYSGWVLLVDEVELIGRYSLRQRARSYAELALLLGKLTGVSLPGLTSVLTISADFEAAVFDDPRRNDEEKIPARYGENNNPNDASLVSQAQKGMQLIRQGKPVIERLTPEVMRAVFDTLRSVYATAYGWEPPADYPEPDITARIRQHVKGWITGWDLKRYYPDYTPELETSPLQPNYAEQPDLEAREEGSPGGDKTGPS